MALTEDRVLVSFEINVQFNTISILWQDRILRDGEIASVANHRGAYTLVAGDIPEHIRDEFNISLAQLTDAAITSLTQANGALLEERSRLLGEIEAAAAIILSLQDQLAAAQQPIPESIPLEQLG